MTSLLTDIDLEQLVDLEQTCVPIFSFALPVGHTESKLLIILFSKTKKKRFYAVGYEDGYAHGRLHGLIEGRALGAEKGFELWEELGFYEGAARLWAAVSSTEANGTDVCVLSPPNRTPFSPVSEPLNLKSSSLILFFPFSLTLFFFCPLPFVRRGAHHASALLALIERFPRKNPRPDEEGVDMSAQLRLIRSRYKTMCASLGVRARLQPAPAIVGTVPEEDGPVPVPVGTSHQGVRVLQDPDADAGTEKKRRQKRMVWALDGPSSSAASSASTQGLSF
jgi:hypothetical protein